MLLRSLSVTTDKDTENCLVIVAVFRQIIIVSTQAVSIVGNAASQRFPKLTSPVQNLGPRQLIPGTNFLP
jgi:hypothetical protein